MNRFSQRLNILSLEQQKFLEMRLRKEGIDIAKRSRGFSVIPCIEKKEYYAVSSAQRRLYVLQQMKIDSTSYNVPDFIRLPVTIDKEAFRVNLVKLIQRHESLRTSFKMINDEPVQRIHDNVDFEVEYHDLTKAGSHRAESVVRNYMKDSENQEFHGSSFIIRHFIRPFDLSQAPLLRVLIIGMAEAAHILMFDIHHIVTDITSQVILIKDFMALYAGKELSPLRLQYKDFSEWQNSDEQKRAMKKQEFYWLKLFSSGELPILNLPYDFLRPEIKDFEGASAAVILQKEETKLLRRISEENDATLFMTILAVYNVLLSKLSGQEDIIVGIPVTSRCRAELNSVVGMFINTLPIRLYPAGGKSFGEFLKEVRQRSLEVFANQEYPFEDLVDKLAVKRDTGRNPIFDVLLSFTNWNEFSDDTSLIGKEHETIGLNRGVAKFDLILDAIERREDIVINFKYCLKLFKAETIDRFLVYFKRIVEELSVDARKKIADIEILSTVDRREIADSIRKRNNKSFVCNKKRIENELKHADVGFNF